MLPLAKGPFLDEAETAHGAQMLPLAKGPFFDEPETTHGARPDGGQGANVHNILLLLLVVLIRLLRAVVIVRRPPRRLKRKLMSCSHCQALGPFADLASDRLFTLVWSIRGQLAC